MSQKTMFYIIFYGLIIALFVDSFLGYIYPRDVAEIIIGILVIQTILILVKRAKDKKSN